ncbi:malate synthase G [Bowmanella sp. JS7-9]|uniref:Malate synthase G n=1 Tax=Pseudobowmanella zhangzhouensis TaxID=1537679 RepID=A0ABW1XKY9_9ALTE|nr:malate synthase G [Bowmanella sp. JS7-9]
MAQTPPYTQYGPLQVATQLATLINDTLLPAVGLQEQDFYPGVVQLLGEFMPRNAALLAKRETLQQQIDQFHKAFPTACFDEYKAFLLGIGYLQPEPKDFCIETNNVDAEIATMAGPQLVVPINNARYALNAANARWGSLYDALYGTDAISEEGGAEKGRQYNPIRGEKVIATARRYLDSMAPLASGKHADAIKYEIYAGALRVTLQDGQKTGLRQPQQLVAYNGEQSSPQCLLLVHNGLHLDIQFDPSHPVGKSDPAGIKDIVLESALTTIMDCEDSVAAVDAEDKTLVYQNWLGLIRGDLSESVQKGDNVLTRTLNGDRHYTALDGSETVLPGRSLMFVRNVGHLMTNDAILFNGAEIPEGILDGIITSLIAKQDVMALGKYRNSRHGSIYIVKPKMHGPEEVAFTNDLFAAIEDLLALPANTLKVGIMDEERRTTVNLKACIAAAKQRVVFINTGFLDRTGDEIHTSMHLGPFARKADIKGMPWLDAYERANVHNGLICGLSGKAQIGKGMWPIPDQMDAMLKAKLGHPKAGANTAWVPSPTAATLHALHYHQVDVFGVQQQLSSQPFDDADVILQIPLLSDKNHLSEEEIQLELENNIQGILGYVVRWVHQGVGCSKVPDIHNVGLMEDRATLRISSQHIANWLLHGLVSREQVDSTMRRMAKLVDEQNAGDTDYIAMAPDFDDSIAFQAAAALIFEGVNQPSGYTEPLLHQKRKEMKARLAAG